MRYHTPSPSPSESSSNRSLPVASSVGDPPSPTFLVDDVEVPPPRLFYRACFLDSNGDPLPPSSPPSDFYRDGWYTNPTDGNEGERQSILTKDSGEGDGGENDAVGIEVQDGDEQADDVANHKGCQEPKLATDAKKLANGRKNAKAYYWRNVNDRRQKANARKQRVRDALDALPSAIREKKLEAVRVKQREYARRSRERKAKSEAQNSHAKPTDTSKPSITATSKSTPSTTVSPRATTKKRKSSSSKKSATHQNPIDEAYKKNKRRPINLRQTDQAIPPKPPTIALPWWI
ncbi:hypothetical protein PQX77_020274 [Marasmius sp. AFHP31]|nr:hypothetical protein PQX77_020274 [Marasmius sp. AFHP31]